ncbi:MAG: DUF5995 family protein [Propionibacteriales bacterium]|nr:DUF5995 family protein [Propionibacteriales bacterium]
MTLLRRTSASLLATVLLTAGLGVSAPRATADDTGGSGDPDPVRGLVLPTFDTLITLFAPLPLPEAPYAGKACVTGTDACIDEVVDRMEVRLDRLSTSCAHSSIFSLAYLRVTENVRDAVRSGYFEDRTWLNRVDVVFAELYFDVTSKWESGQRTGLPRAWQIALKAEEDRTMSGLGNFMLAMNAHINRDFPHVLAEVGLTGPKGSHKADHNRYNNRLDTLYGPVFAEEARRFDPSFDDIDAGTLEETAAGVIMRGWREMVWRHAEALTLAKTPAARRLVEQEIELYSTVQAQLIRTLLVAQPAKRDAWCAAHGRDD